MATETSKWRISHRGEVQVVSGDAVDATLTDMIGRLGPYEPGVTSVTEASGSALGNSTWNDLKTDQAAKTRIEAMHEALKDAGADVGDHRQLYATGTRMADSGYAYQKEKEAEHSRQELVKTALGGLVDQVKAEKRVDVTVTAGDFASKLAINGAVTFDGLKLREQAVRGLLGRLKSPALGYIFGLRDRIASKDATPVAKAMDREALLDVIQREARRFPDIKLVLRTRQGLGDVFATVSPDYSVADVPQVVPQLLQALPADARGSVSYDPTSTTWNLRASVWTPVPADEQAVGEPFTAYVSITSRDNGTHGVEGGGGITLVACLNASEYRALVEGLRRIHRGNVLADLQQLIFKSSAAISTLAQAWGTARAQVIEAPTVGGKLIPIEEAVPGFFRSMLTARRGELVGLLPGRTETRVAGLAQVFPQERRNPNQVTRADLAQAYTRYIQDETIPVRRTAEAGIGRWLATGEEVGYATA
jgi:hypothetical protein